MTAFLPILSIAASCVGLTIVGFALAPRRKDRP